jgi:hypothetical protein
MNVCPVRTLWVACPAPRDSSRAPRKTESSPEDTCPADMVDGTPTAASKLCLARDTCERSRVCVSATSRFAAQCSMYLDSTKGKRATIPNAMRGTWRARRRRFNTSPSTRNLSPRRILAGGCASFHAAGSKSKRPYSPQSLIAFSASNHSTGRRFSQRRWRARPKRLWHQLRT